MLLSCLLRYSSLCVRNVISHTRQNYSFLILGEMSALWMLDEWGLRRVQDLVQRMKLTAHFYSVI